MTDVALELRGPAIAGVRVEGRGHFIPVLAVTNGFAELGDPLVGYERAALSDLSKQREFTGFLMTVKRADR